LLRPQLLRRKRQNGATVSATSSSDELKARVAAALAANVGPALEMDGTLLEVLDVTDGIARIRLNGVCGNCPGSIMLVINGIEEELRKHVPEVAYIEAVP
jgi:Fe-S cluster biogenesis protein NfuA